jgi:hypothetical protein
MATKNPVRLDQVHQRRVGLLMGVSEEITSIHGNETLHDLPGHERVVVISEFEV